MNPETKKRLFAYRRIRITTPGKLYLLVTIGVGIAAINSSNNLVYLAESLLLSSLVLSGILSEISVRRLEAKRSFKENLTAGKTGLYEIVLRNRSPLPSFSLQGDGKTVLGMLQGRSIRRIGIDLQPLKRGYFEFDDITIATRYPFGFIERTRIFPETAQRIIVWPAPVSPSALHSEAPAVRGFLMGEQSDISVYEMGDDARTINWTASAKTGTLMKNVYSREGGIDHLVFVADGSSGDIFEHAVSVFAGYVNHYNASGSRIEISIESAEMKSFNLGDSGAYVGIMNELSLVQPSVTENSSVSRDSSERTLLVRGSLGH